MINPNPTPSVRMRTTNLVIRLTQPLRSFPPYRVGSNRLRHVRPLQGEKRATRRSIQKRVDKNTADVMLR